MQRLTLNRNISLFLFFLNAPFFEVVAYSILHDFCEYAYYSQSFSFSAQRKIATRVSFVAFKMLFQHFSIISC